MYSVYGFHLLPRYVFDPDDKLFAHQYIFIKIMFGRQFCELPYQTN